MNIETTMPDFKKWAESLWNSWEGPMTLDVQQALRQAFEQGRALGGRESDGVWWEEQNASLEEWSTENEEETMALFERASLEDYEKYEQECSRITRNSGMDFCDQMTALSSVRKPWENNEASKD